MPKKPDQDDGPNSRGLTPRGEQRAEAYANYFDPLRIDGHTLQPQRLIATSDSKNSERPRLTLTPLAARLQLPLEQPFADKQVDKLVDSLRRQNQAGVVLIAWHHGELGNLINAFGGDLKTLVGKDKWPGDVYNWLIVLRFDDRGQLIPSSSHLVAGASAAGRLISRPMAPVVISRAPCGCMTGPRSCRCLKSSENSTATASAYSANVIQIAVPVLAAIGADKPRIDDQAAERTAQHRADTVGHQHEQALRAGAYRRVALPLDEQRAGDIEKVERHAVDDARQHDHPQLRPGIAVGEKPEAQRPRQHADQHHRLDAEALQEERESPG